MASNIQGSIGTVGSDWISTDALTWKPEQKGEALQGYLTMKRPRAEDRSAYYQIQDQEGNLHIVWGSAVLDSRMKAVSEGEEVRITFQGTKPSPKGKHPMKLFEVLHRKAGMTEVEEGV